MSELSLFHRELFSFLKKSSLAHAEAEGFTRLQKSLDEAAPFDQVLHDYQQLFSEKNGLEVEWQWMNSFSAKEFEKLGLTPYFPKIYRGLPKLYARDDPTKFRIKKQFTDLSALRALSVDRALFSLYEGVQLERKMGVAILTWVMSDGLGDWTAALKTAEVFQAKFPHLEIHLVALTARPLPMETKVPTHIIPYEKDKAPFVFPFDKKKLLREMDLILEIPTFFPETSALLAELGKMASLRPFPKIECVGEYGFLESAWFHPKTGNRSMGLHALEKGILVRTGQPGPIETLENKTLLSWLLEEGKRHFHLGYLSTAVGGALYLHSLLKMWERDEKGIDLCSPDIGWLLRWIEERNSLQLPVLEESYGVKEIILYFQEHRHIIPISDKGKTVRILSPPGKLSSADMQTLLSFSEDWVAVRGNQSFSEAVSAGKPFFYDGRGHARYFLKDLFALAENRLSGHRDALHIFRMMGQAFLWNLPDEEGEWVDESYFQRQEKMSFAKIAHELGARLQKPQTLAGFKAFCRTIQDEFSCNDFLCHLVQRSLFHRLRPDVAEEERQLIPLYAKGQIPFSTLVNRFFI